MEIPPNDPFTPALQEEWLYHQAYPQVPDMTTADLYALRGANPSTSTEQLQSDWTLWRERYNHVTRVMETKTGHTDRNDRTTYAK